MIKSFKNGYHRLPLVMGDTLVFILFPFLNKRLNDEGSFCSPPLPTELMRWEIGLKLATVTRAYYLGSCLDLTIA